MTWSDTIRSKSDRLLRCLVPADTDITYQCIFVALALALLPTIVAHAVVYLPRLQGWRGKRHGRAGAPPAREERERTQKERRWLDRSARATEAALAGLGLFAAGVAALQAERVRPLEANMHCLVYLFYRAQQTVWALNHVFDWVSPATAATPLHRWAAGPAYGATLAGLATAQVMAMFYDASAHRNRAPYGGRNIWFKTW